MSAKTIIYQCLTSDPTVSELAQNITQGWYNANLTHPQITISRVAEAGESYGDNERQVSGTPMQVDIWTDQSPTALEVAVKYALLQLPEYQRSDLSVVGDTSEDGLNRVTIQVTIYE